MNYNISILKKATLRLQPLHRKHGKVAFISKLPQKAKLFDVGCGNASSNKIKYIRPDLYYIGIDICEYNPANNIKEIADEIIITSPEKFHIEIENRKNHFDAILSAHNLEHCNEPTKVMNAMIESLKKGGVLYLSFPSDVSVNFPSDKIIGLNFFDDPTHNQVINFRDTINYLKSNEMQIIYSAHQYKSFLFYVLGLIVEPFRRLFNIHISTAATWAYWGFESIIIAKKLSK